MTKMPANQGKLIYYGYLKKLDISQLDISDMVGKQQYYTTSNVLYVMEMIIFHIGGNHEDSHFSSKSKCNGYYLTCFTYSEYNKVY